MKTTDDRKLFDTLIGASAASGNIATIPQTQATAGDGTASVALGFPPETFIARAAGGEPPRGQDMNGFLNRLSAAVQILQAGYLGPFDETFAQGIGGYPAGAIVSGSTPGTFWVSTADANVSTPGASGATWQSLFNGLAVLNGGNTFTGAQNITGALNVTGTITALVASSTQKVTFRRASTYGGINSYDGSSWHPLMINDDDTASTAKGTLAFSDAVQTFTETQTFEGEVLVPDVDTFGGKDALNAETAEGRYVKSVPAAGQTRITDLVENADGRAVFGDGTNTPVLANLSDLPFSDPTQKIQAFTAYVQFSNGTTSITFPRAFKAGTVPTVILPSTQEQSNKWSFLGILILSNGTLAITNTGVSIYGVGWGGGGTFANLIENNFIPVIAVGEF